MKRLFFLALISLVGKSAFIGGNCCALIAQQTHPILQASRIPPRVEDHFWRRKVLHRIDLGEKVNEPLLLGEPALGPLYGPQTYDYGERKGVVSALLNGLKSGKYLAYQEDSLHKSMTYDDVKAIYTKITEGGSGGDDWDTEEGGMDDFEAGDDFESDEFAEEGDDMGEEEDDLDLEGDTDPSDEGAKSTVASGEIEPTAFESVLEIIEDRIFDKNRSDMVFDIQYIRLVWVDPAETQPDKNFVCFKYSDVLETLEDTQWKNQYNDAEYRNLREIFELRLFNSDIFSVSGRGAKDLAEAEYRRDQLVEFEHNLWNY